MDSPLERSADGAATKRSIMSTPLKPIFEAAAKYEASDVHLRAGGVAKLRIDGRLKSLETKAFDAAQFEQWIRASLSDEQWQYYTKHGSIDLGVSLSQKYRFRINIFRTMGRSALAARLINDQVANFKDLHLPPIVEKIAQFEQGLVLICGITGSGKSTTLASIVQFINERRACHVVTIEDPIEYLFKDAKATINQREVGIDVPDFATGIRAMLREDPDVILVGEMRDRETFETAVQAAETGHLVFGTIHASSTSQAFGRIYDLFSAAERENVRTMLAFQLQAFLYQKLLPTLRQDVKRIPGVEILLQSPPTRKYILDGREHSLDEVIKQHRELGMQTFTDSLVELVNKEYIHPRVAHTAALNPDEIKMRLRGILAE